MTHLSGLVQPNQCKQTCTWTKSGWAHHVGRTSGFDTPSSKSHHFSRIINTPPFPIITSLHIRNFFSLLLLACGFSLLDSCICCWESLREGKHQKSKFKKFTYIDLDLKILTEWNMHLIHEIIGRYKIRNLLLELSLDFAWTDLLSPSWAIQSNVQFFNTPNLVQLEESILTRRRCTIIIYG